MINPESVQEWRGNPVTIEMLQLLEQEKARIMEAMANGNFLNMDSMEYSFGNTAHAVGEIAGINRVFQLLQEEENE